MEAHIPRLLQKVAEGYNAERAFVVEQEGPQPRVLWSTTIDGDQVPDASNRIPSTLLRAARAAESRILTPESQDLPPALKQEFADLGRKGALLCRLTAASGRPTFLFLENRFCPL